MSKRQKSYYIVEHTWRLLRATFLLAGTAFWLFTTVSPFIIFGFYVGAAIVDQLHGAICSLIEKVFNLPHQHENWD